eukprot:c26846_g1_i1 orf=506-1804(-)
MAFLFACEGFFISLECNFLSDQGHRLAPTSSIIMAGDQDGVDLRVSGVRNTPMTRFPNAAQPEVMRAAEKDEHYVSHVCDACHDAFRHVFGTRLAVAYQNETKLAGRVLYYLLTTGSGLQTLGEEYCDISQVAGSSGLPLTPARRILLVFYQTVLPYIANRLSVKAAARGVLLASQHATDSQPDATPNQAGNLSRFERGGMVQFTDVASQGLRTINGGELLGNSVLSQWLRRTWLSAIQYWSMVLPSVREALLLVVRTNLMLFYFEGLYYHLAKRVAGVRYIFMGKLFHQRPRYHMLGVFLLIQLCIVGGDWLRRTVIPALATSMRSHSMHHSFSTASQAGFVLLDEDGNQVNKIPGQHAVVTGTGKAMLENFSSSKCPLCLSPRQHPTATPCGHVFCWTCVAEWCNEKLECPLCRSPVSHSELVCIYHSDF